jgi:hypothetical protein
MPRRKVAVSEFSTVVSIFQRLPIHTLECALEAGQEIYKGRLGGPSTYGPVAGALPKERKKREAKVDVEAFLEEAGVGAAPVPPPDPPKLRRTRGPNKPKNEATPLGGQPLVETPAEVGE